MRCSNCGKEIPFGGKVCQWCGADKSKDQTRTVFSGFFGLVGGALGYFIAGGIVCGIFGLAFGVVLGMMVAEKINKPAAKISAASKVLLSLVLVLFIGWLVSSLGDKNSSPSSQDRGNVRLEEKITQKDMATAEIRAGDPSSSTTSGVKGISANWLLAKQLNRHKEVEQLFRASSEKTDVEACKRILVVRSAELAQIIDEVLNGSYSIDDKQKMLVPLQQEKDWADKSIELLSQH
jgi:hypothetical protein